MADVIGLFLRSADNAYQRQLKATAERMAGQHGFDLLVQSVQFDAGAQVAQIRAAIENAATTKLSAIMVSGVRDADLLPVAHEAAEAGLDFAVLNDADFIEALRPRYPNRALFTAAADQTEIGRLQAREVRALCGDEGHAMCVTGNMKNLEAHLRLAGLRQGLGEGFKIAEVNADWTSEGARLAVERWVAGLAGKNDFPTVFVAQNDEMALGVRQALRDIESRRDWTIGAFPVMGCDGAEDFGQRLVREGRIKATVIMTPASGPAIEWIARVRQGGELPPARLVLPVNLFLAAPPST
jgi:ABC-type sugar transport system substrate-binding protein